MPTITQEELIAYAAIGRKEKEVYVTAHGGPIDTPLHLVVELDNGEMWQGRATSETYRALNAQELDIGELIYHSVLDMIIKIGLSNSIERVFVTSDAHIRVAASLDEAVGGSYRHGDFQKDFETNPASEVKEVIVTWCAERSESRDVIMSTAYSPYRHGDDGLVVWDETETIMHQVLSEDDNSNVAPAMVHLFHAMGVIADV